MTSIKFYFNVPHIHRQVALLGEMALAKGRRVFVLTTDAAATRELELALWSHTPTSFLPHCRSRDRFAAEAPIVIDWDGSHLPHDDVLINLQPAYPPFFSRFRRLIELVGQETPQRDAARDRYRFYRDRGYELSTIDVAAGGA